MDFNRSAFSQEDHRDTYNRFYPYHEEMQRLFGVPVYEERKRMERYLNAMSHLFGNTEPRKSKSDSGVSSPNFTDTRLNSPENSLNSSGNTASYSDGSPCSPREFLPRSYLSPGQSSSPELSWTTFRDSCLKTSTPTTTSCTCASNYKLFGNNSLDLASQISNMHTEKKPKPSLPIDHKCVCRICSANSTPSVGIQLGNYDRSAYSDVLMARPRNSRVKASNFTNELRRMSSEPTPGYTGFAFPTAARAKKEKSKVCKFCKKNGELADIYIGHETKDTNERVTCPILRRYICELCGATGDKAHTRKYCPNYVGLEEPLPMFRRLANGVISISHNHK